MCFPVSCKKCGKQSWGGCGKHLRSVYDRIDNGNHCMCRSWPGIAIVIPSQGTTPSQNPPPASSGTTAAAPAAEKLTRPFGWHLDASDAGQYVVVILVSWWGCS
ncbi:hypothetical protein FNV43_RR17136 [Rhamnella rubrinervis]|uniref:Uncharacterized protein n=1 Tax=Rhamnella rubrinervis TaxID=2594499 RepID=A0A8K0DY80_9ROSA|nr:hypothetical protein FNV43_RR17136 [Rhamnella rubrinervis]